MTMHVVDAAGRLPIEIVAPRFGPEEEAAVLAVMRSGRLVQGQRVLEFERRFAEMVGSRHAIATSNGLTALRLALVAHGVGPGDEVVTTPQSFAATAKAIVHTGAVPVFADVDDTLNLSPKAVEAVLTPRTRAILAVHLHGNPADLGRLGTIGNTHRLLLLQDSSQAAGATFRGLGLARFGTAAFSLHASENLTTREGGMIVTNSDRVAATCRRLRHRAYGDQPHLHEGIRHKVRMTELQAAIGIARLGRLDAITRSRRRLAAWYDAELDPERYLRPRVLPEAGHAYHQYTIRFPGGPAARDRARAALAAAGIASGVYYPVPLHRQPPYRTLPARCPKAERAAQDMLSIPVHPGVTPADAGRVVEVLNRL